MSIPESQLETWSHQGSVAQSSATYKTIKNALEAAGTPYSDKSYDVFLQGSYRNHTNIYADSDVDIVIQLNGCFQHDLSELPNDQKQAFQAAFANATYTHVDFKRDVLRVANSAFGGDVLSGDKAISIEANGGRRKADVLAAIRFRRYYKFRELSDQRYDVGICFYDSSGQCIVNYPKQHSENLTTKHKNASQWFKPMARVLKNLRSRLIDEKMIAKGVAPSYFLEGLLYNVPNVKFGISYSDSFINCVTWIQEADKSKFVCANEQYYLLRDNSSVTWRKEECAKFLAAAVELWNQW